ncbi:CcoQ/FixQ family Cbb3-type cytochrome c oxidase assembly chaperone [Segetibacter sp. 3557_3]|uniref:CcoQ/FixQ family Cbb3-type cytochrome c oxidase assembly chaperone n=1 Tax=Segetibacter sp. 3557_3 TaxID=2547429 RepID=UPI001058FDFE|nr:CcoQ/FixQ family Cbb3-type cytochrome c oxidase assembly chaperone [Segetibacter sp. 3557_3]TDH24652.1 CcoQ/FixQ family Cbb3-type cytochrome c oxidase assembly chaperone [Segetibacter sp. 3557_3]
MKFINYLEKIAGVDIYALSSFLIFFFFFLIMTLWALRADKKMIAVLSNIPLEENSDNN